MVDSSVDKEQIKQVILFLDSKEVRIAIILTNLQKAQGQALDIILAYSTTPQNRELFHGTDICKILLRLLPEGNSVRIASCLINFSADKDYVKELISLNVSTRVFDFLKTNVKMDMKSPEQTSAHFLEDDNAYVIRDSSNQDISQAIEQLLMMLSNVTINEEGQRHLLGTGATKGAILDNLFGMFCYFGSSGNFDFISNVLSNVSALKEGRNYMLENKMLQKLVELLKGNKINSHRRIHLIECIRNIVFEYEPYEKLFIANTKNLLDTLMLLANSEELLKQMDKLNLVEALDKVYSKNVDDIEVQVQVLKNQIASLGMPKTEDDDEEEWKNDFD
ncbi:duf383 domain containing protein [Stylonychia lemnae]|uniref:Duf383 domain containing protein n=1 Tax=Stylonychia lemnae TaxID=5949 RepID=A0A078AAY6_STYLE|nr:duf383 domain containing protein [Stylonychia lemnae]|eukprot:CDW79364.1 duf383 domain containing protein [Stylonychia lemnae]